MPRPNDALHADRLVGRIRREFPELAISTSRLVEQGDDHAVLIVNRRLVFRFPRGPEYQRAFGDELKITAAIAEKSPVRVPRYTFVARDESFGSYRLIPGREMTVARFARLTAAQRRGVMQMVARFLSRLHRLNRNVLPRYRARAPWSGTDVHAQREQYWNERRAVLAPLVGTETLRMIDAFYDSHVGLCAKCPAPAVIHGDLTDDHMLLDPRRGRLNGIIDFADAAIGDPAQDFGFLWSYGDSAPKAAYGAYELQDDGRLLERSRLHYLRYAVHRVFYCAQRARPAAAFSVLRRLRQQLKAIGA